jgi:hypothetical protein
MISLESIDGILADLAAGELSQLKIAAKWRVANKTVSRIACGKHQHANKRPGAIRPLRETPAASIAATVAPSDPEPQAWRLPPPRTLTWSPTPTPAPAPQPKPEAKPIERKGSVPYEDEAGSIAGPLAQLVVKLKIHVEKKEFEPVRRLLGDPDLRVLAAALIHADGKQWNAVERIVSEYDGTVDDGLSLDTWIAESGLPVRVVNQLEEAGYTTFATLAGVPRSRLEAIPSMGTKGIDLVVAALRRAVENTQKLETAGATRGLGDR